MLFAWKYQVSFDPVSWIEKRTNFYIFVWSAKTREGGGKILTAYFTLKVLSVLKIFKFLSSIFCHIEKQLDKKDKVNFKFMTSQPGKQKISMHIMSNISRSKGNQRMKFGQLIECNTRNIFFEKSYT